jgi:hypothetical protein
MKTAPRITKKLQMIAAVENLIIRVPIAVPKTLAASFAPRAHPKNRPLDINKRTVISN